MELDPDYAEAHYNFGVALAGRGQTEPAMEHYQKALEIKPDFATARQNLDVVLSRRSSILKALAGQRPDLARPPAVRVGAVQSHVRIL